MTVQPDISRRALRDQVHDRILAMLLGGELAPGERLSIDTVARDLQVSPTPVREAMVQLERTGLVTREALKGYRVAPPLDAEQLGELFDARIALEVAAAELAARDAERLLPTLEAAQARHRTASEAVVVAHERGGTMPVEITQAYFDADREVHAAIFRHAGNRYLLAMYDDLGALTHRMRQAALRGPDDVHEAVAEHEAMVAAFRDCPAAAVDAVRTHVANVRARSIVAD